MSQALCARRARCYKYIIYKLTSCAMTRNFSHFFFLASLFSVMAIRQWPPLRRFFSIKNKSRYLAACAQLSPWALHSKEDAMRWLAESRWVVRLELAPIIKFVCQKSLAVRVFVCMFFFRSRWLSPFVVRLNYLSCLLSLFFFSFSSIKYLKLGVTAVVASQIDAPLVVGPMTHLRTVHVAAN